MKKAFVERSLAAMLFVLVLVVFSLAERDTQKLMEQYTSRPASSVQQKAGDLTASLPVPPKGK
jgi:hypothetical protein